MAKRGHDFKMRLLDDEAADLAARAARDGLAKADVIRKAMGWEPVELVKAPSPGDRDVSPPPPPPTSASSEPGVSGMAGLAKRIEDRRRQ